MRPTEFEKQYHKLSVPYEDAKGMPQKTQVDIHIYRQRGKNEEVPEKDLIVAMQRAEIRKAQAQKTKLKNVERSQGTSIALAFYGKGTPDDCALALRYAIRYKRALPINLQNYCDSQARIGLDCSGFVNNYFKAVGILKGDRNIPDYAKGQERHKISDICDRDVLIWADSKGKINKHPSAHIAVVDTKPDANGSALIVESASSLGGLTHSKYLFSQTKSSPASTSVFKVKRLSRTSYVRVFLVS